MPVDVLWVEGYLDLEILGWILDLPGLTLRRGGSKHELGKRVKWDREANQGRGIYFLRDRDFRGDTEEGRIEPYEERTKGGTLIGWHLCRHDIESYLLEPALLATAVKKEPESVERALAVAAEQIKHFAAARWVIGSLRPSVPFNYDLETAPENLGEYQLPAALDRRSQEKWCREHVAAFRDRSNWALSDERLDAEVERRFELFESNATRTREGILHWFPGKNLLPAVATELGFAGGAGDVLPKLKSRLAKNPKILAELPEMQALKAQLRQTP